VESFFQGTIGSGHHAVSWSGCACRGPWTIFCKRRAFTPFIRAEGALPLRRLPCLYVRLGAVFFVTLITTPPRALDIRGLRDHLTVLRSVLKMICLVADACSFPSFRCGCIFYATIYIPSLNGLFRLLQSTRSCDDLPILNRVTRLSIFVHTTLSWAPSQVRACSLEAV